MEDTGRTGASVLHGKMEQLEETTFPMAAHRRPRDPLARRLRHFAWSIALFLAVLSWLVPHAHVVGLAAAFVFALGTVLPQTFHWPFFALHRLLRTVLPATLVTSFLVPSSTKQPSRKRRKNQGTGVRNQESGARGQGPETKTN